MAGQAAAPATADARKLVLDRYDRQIDYYWHASEKNKRAYKTTRYLSILLGAVVTLVAALQHSDFIKGNAVLLMMFNVATPVFATVLAIIGGFSQTFQWGSTWSDMAMTASRLEKERDRIAVTPPGDLDAVKEMEVLDDLVLSETQGFFARMFGTGGPAKAGG